MAGASQKTTTFGNSLLAAASRTSDAEQGGQSPQTKASERSEGAAGPSE